MKSTRIGTLLIGLCVLSLGAGLAAGMLASRLPSGAPTAPPTDVAALERTPLTEELGLSDEQRDQMRIIWEDARRKVHAAFDDAQQLQRQRDEALVALLNDEQKAKFERISKDFADRFADLTRRRDQTFESAVAKTKELLNETQRAKYDQILKDHVGPAGAAPAAMQ